MDIIAVVFGIVFWLMFIYFYIYKLVFGIILGKIGFAVGVLRLVSVFAVLLVFAMGLGVFQEFVEAVFSGGSFVVRDIQYYVRLVAVDDAGQALEAISRVMSGYVG